MFAGYLGPSICSPRFYAPTAWPRAGPFWNPMVKSHENRSHVVLGLKKKHHETSIHKLSIMVGLWF